jgi:hypothetical protein
MASILPSRRDMWLEKEPAGSAAFERGWRAALAYVLRREHLRRTVRVALVVGIVLTTVNQLDVMARGDATAITWIKSGTNFVISFIVSNLGLLSGRTFAARRSLTSVR